MCWKVIILMLISLSSVRGAEKNSQVLHAGLQEFLARWGYYPIPLTKDDQNSLLTPGKILDRKCTIIVDTGCGLTHVHRSFLRNARTLGELGVAVQDSLFGTVTDSDLVLLESLELGECLFTNQPVARARSFTRGYPAVLGEDFLNRNFCLIDCLDNMLYVRTSQLSTNGRPAIAQSLRRSGFQQIEMRMRIGLRPTCEVSLGNAKMEFLVDTGAVWSFLDDSVARRLRMNTKTSRLRIRGQNVGLEDLSTVEVNSLKIGSAELRKVTIGVARLEPWQLAEKSPGTNKISGILGADLLAMNEAIIDFGWGILWLRPRETK